MNDPADIRVVVAEDNPLVLEGIVAVLRATSDLDLAGRAANGHEALAVICEHRPDVALVDLHLRGLDGFAIAERVSKNSRDVRLVAMGVNEDLMTVRRALAAGFQGYLVKRSAVDCLGFAIRSVAAGGVYIDPFVASGMIDRKCPPATRVRAGQIICEKKPLTAREEEVLRLVARGFTIKEVAVQLGVTDKSIETHKLRASEKLQLGSRAKIVEYGMSCGWFNHS
jgi:DNA-binding NarL/FixJ family response regulator